MKITRDENHIYWHGKERLIGMNSLLEFYGLRAPYTGDEFYTNRGTNAHLMAKLYLNGVLDEDSLSPALQPYLEGLKKLCREHKLETFKTEEFVYSVDDGVAGQLDWFGRFDGVRTIIDWTLASKFQSAKALQTAGYIYLKNLVLPEAEKVTNRLVVRLTPFDYKLAPKAFYDKNDEHVITSCIRLWRKEKDRI